MGANGTIAADEVAHSRPDGYTLFMAVTSQIAIAPAVMNVRYDPVKSGNGAFSLLLSLPRTKLRKLRIARNSSCEAKAPSSLAIILAGGPVQRRLCLLRSAGGGPIVGEAET